MPLPGTDDGVPAAQLNKPKSWGKIASYFGVALVALLPAYVSGRSCAARENYNLTINQAADIQVEVEKISKTLNLINDRINASPDAAKNNPDVKLAEDLGTLEIKDPDTQKIFHTNYFFMTDLAIERLFGYYNDAIRLFRLIKDHAKKTGADADQIANFVTNGGLTGGDKNYGIVFDLSGALPLAHFVEVGKPICPVEGQTDCNATELKGFKYRIESGGTWSEKGVNRAKLAESVIPMQQTPLFKSVMSGNPDILAVKDHIRRMVEIKMLSAKMFNDQKALLTDLKTHSEKQRVFTF
ncbi:MAG: hypothetical protein EXR72_04935 [Myxococcales bacterium]|nr:hypothetical protein [Myxococcales bacterium]